jgi:hypothetical protein
MKPLKEPFLWASPLVGAALATRKAPEERIFRWIRLQLRANRSRVPLYRLWGSESSSLIDCGLRLPVEWLQGVWGERAAGCGTALRRLQVSQASLSPVYQAVLGSPGRRHRWKLSMDESLRTSSIVVVAKEQVSCPLGEESAILNLKNSVYYGLDPIGARVWTLLQQPRSVGELRDTLLSEYEVEAGRCEQDLLSLLETMRSEGLIEVRAVSAA